MKLFDYSKASAKKATRTLTDSEQINSISFHPSGSFDLNYHSVLIRRSFLNSLKLNFDLINFQAIFWLWAPTNRWFGCMTSTPVHALLELSPTTMLTILILVNLWKLLLHTINTKSFLYCEISPMLFIGMIKLCFEVKINLHFKQVSKCFGFKDRRIQNLGSSM